MIVQIHEKNSDKYRKLFTEAYEALEQLDENLLTVKGKGQFSNLAEYYGHIAHLFNHSEYKYIMLPLDEEPFKIDLNTRTIEVPQSFSKCASVQTDMLAETIIFIADRFFDYMDLANTIIYVQWTAPDGFKGATRVEMRDLDSEPGKSKFAWPLNNLSTRVPGVVKFAVRFFNFSDSEEDGKELVYSLNTLTSEITIKPALQPEGPSQVETNTLDLFKKAVVNSNYAATGVIPPMLPEFTAPGSDIATKVEILDENGNGTGEYAIKEISTETNEINYMKMTGMTEEKFINGIYWVKDGDNYVKAKSFNADEIYFIQILKGSKYIGLEDNTITLYAQAVTYDTGEIGYKWYYQAQDGEYNDKPYDCEAIGFGEVREVYVNVGKNPPALAHERYYEADGMGGYTDYTGDLPAPFDLYERYTSLTIPADSEDNPVAVTGLYHAAAWYTIDASGYSKVDNLTEEKFHKGNYYVKLGNRWEIETNFDPSKTYYVYVTGKELTTNFPVETSTCLLPGPRPIVVSKDLASRMIFDETERITLEVEIQDDAYNPEISYDWRMSAISEDNVFTDADIISSDNLNIFSIEGYSEIEVEDEDIFNNGIYYILDENNKYVRATEYSAIETYFKDNAGWYGVNITSKLNRKEETLPSQIVKITHNPIPPKIEYIEDEDILVGRLTATNSRVNFTVNVDTNNLDINNKLESDNIEYVWQMSLANQSWVTLTAKETGIELNGNVLTITDAFTQPYASFRCLVINDLNGQKAIFDHSSDSDGIDNKMGIFENNPPYIFEDNKSFAFLLYNTKK